MNSLIKSICVLLTTFLLSPTAVADVLVGSWAGDSVRRYDDAGTYLGDFVPPGSGGLNLPDGMDFGADGNLYVSSSLSNQVLRYDGTTGAFIDAFVNSGLSAPGNLKFGPDGFLYVCNKNTGQVLRFDPGDGSLIDVFASGGGLVNPVGLLWDGGLLYVADFNGGAVRRYDATTGAYVDNFAAVSTPLILNHDLNGNILVSGHVFDNIQSYATDGTFLGNFLSGGTVDCPVGYVFTSQSEVIVASWQNHRLLRYDAQTGSFLGEFASGNGLLQPNDVLLMPQTAEVAPETVTVTRGELASGNSSDLNASDNSDLIVRRRGNDIQARTQFEIQSTSPFATASEIEVQLEGSVFARSTVEQTIELFDFEAGTWVTIDTRAASRLTDTTATVVAPGSSNRFIETGSQSIRARISFLSIVARQRFSSNTDLFQWKITQ